MKNTTLQFLKKLEKNNNRDWFNENKKLYIEAHGDVINFVEILIEKISKFDEAIGKMDAKKSMFRIYRDTRFSKDKSPYKTNFGVNLGIGKGGKTAGYYLHIEPEKSFLAGGVYMPEPGNLKAIRKEISLFGDEFLKILNHKNFKKYFSKMDENDKLKKIPQGFESNDPMAEYLKLKHFTVSYPVSDEELLSETAAENFAEIFKSIKPLNDFLETPF
ncbi:MAG: DUF2461 domain-containing protein [Flavobacteriaceae bacterium]|jgi:uncharacterized protein (TIGR02453 family)|nr:DUF2461 domain-containing protein [Flavobacteriaceae bacterium]